MRTERSRVQRQFTENQLNNHRQIRHPVQCPSVYLLEVDTSHSVAGALCCHITNQKNSMQNLITICLLSSQYLRNKHLFYSFLFRSPFTHL